MMLTLGICIPVEMHRFSTRLYTLLFSLLSSGFEFVAELIIAVWENQAIMNQMTIPIVIQGIVERKERLTSIRFDCSSSSPNDMKKKKSQVRPKKTTGKSNKSNTEFVLFFLIWLCSPKYFILLELDLRWFLNSGSFFSQFEHGFAFEVEHRCDQVRREHFSCYIQLFCG